MPRIGITECKVIKFSEIDHNRYIDCAGYDDCLSEAVKRDMQSFHCNNCHAFQEYKRAKKDNTRYMARGNIIQRFRPGHVSLDEKNIGTLWND